jgi:hypothetical protein
MLRIRQRKTEAIMAEEDKGLWETQRLQTRKPGMQIPLSNAIQQLRDQLREAILEGKDKDIGFTPNGIDIVGQFQRRDESQRRC